MLAWITFLLSRRLCSRVRMRSILGNSSSSDSSSVCVMGLCVAYGSPKLLLYPSKDLHAMYCNLFLGIKRVIP